MKHEITIIIPTYERHRELLKSIQYWIHLNIKVIIVDGSSESLYGKNSEKTVHNIEYYHLPFSIEERLIFASQKICSDFASLISDDEFFIYSGLIEACKILHKNKQIGSVLGGTLAFKKENNTILYKIEYESALKLKIDGSTPEKRIKDRFKVTGNSICYPLVRSKILKQALSFIGERKYSCPYISEYQMETALCAASKIKVLPILFWLRNRNGNIINNKTYNRNIFFHNWLTDKNNFEEINKLRKSFEKYLYEIYGKKNSTKFDILEEICDFEKRSLGLKESFSDEKIKKNILMQFFQSLPFFEKKRRAPNYLWHTFNSIERDLKKLKISWSENELQKINTLLLQS